MTRQVVWMDCPPHRQARDWGVDPIIYSAEWERWFRMHGVPTLDEVMCMHLLLDTSEHTLQYVTSRTFSVVTVRLEAGPLAPPQPCDLDDWTEDGWPPVSWGEIRDGQWHPVEGEPPVMMPRKVR